MLCGAPGGKVQPRDEMRLGRFCWNVHLLWKNTRYTSRELLLHLCSLAVHSSAWLDISSSEVKFRLFEGRSKLPQCVIRFLSSGEFPRPTFSSCRLSFQETSCGCSQCCFLDSSFFKIYMRPEWWNCLSLAEVNQSVSRPCNTLVASSIQRVSN